MKLLGSGLLFLVTTAYCLSHSDYQIIMEDLESNWIGKPQLPPKALRLAFHDCITVCDGCLNLAGNDNKGLIDVVADLEVIYSTYSSLLSRADFWAMAAISSINYGIEESNVNCTPNDVLTCPTMPPLSTVFRFGRVDCSGSPFYTNETERDFPTPRMTATQMFDYFAMTDGPGFGFSSDEVAALMGAHTMGSLHPCNSGHEGDWLPEHTIQFNNQFYQLMLSPDVTWANINPSTSEENPRYQWRAHDFNNQTTYGNFLNTDFETLYDLLLNSNFSVTTCSVDAANPTCPQSSTHAKAASYAANADTWMIDFSAVFEKMIENGYDTLDDLTT